MSIKITRFEAENIKRVKAVAIEPSKNGLTVIGGKNGQGKTSVLDAIAWVLGGNKYRPSEPRRDGSAVPPALHLELSNGLVVERNGKNSDLKVIDPSGNKAGQSLIDELISQLALDLPKFMRMNNKEKANILLQIIGVGDQLYGLEHKEEQLYNRRHEIGQIADQKKKFAAEMVEFPDVPLEPVSATELIRQQQGILATNGANQRKREAKERYEKELVTAQAAFKEAEKRLQEAKQNVETARQSAESLQDESTAKLEENIADIDALNQKVRANMDKERAENEAEDYGKQYADLTAEIEQVRRDKTALLESANLPLSGLSVIDGELTYKGYRWDNMSSSDQLKVSTAIVRKLNPSCGFVLLDKLEQMDLDTLKGFGEWLEQEELQAIATRVSVGDECAIIIEDGYGAEEPAGTNPVEKNQTWKAGEF